MNTQIKLLVIAISSFLLSFSAFKSEHSKAVSFDSETSVAVTKTEAYQDARETETDVEMPANSKPQKRPDIKGLLPEDDGHIHHFHLERVRKAKKHSNTLCVIAKIVITLIHIALLICGYCHVVSH